MEEYLQVIHTLEEDVDYDIYTLSTGESFKFNTNKRIAERLIGNIETMSADEKELLIATIQDKAEERMNTLVIESVSLVTEPIQGIEEPEHITEPFIKPVQINELIKEQEQFIDEVVEPVHTEPEKTNEINTAEPEVLQVSYSDQIKKEISKLDISTVSDVKDLSVYDNINVVIANIDFEKDMISYNDVQDDKHIEDFRIITAVKEDAKDSTNGLAHIVRKEVVSDIFVKLQSASKIEQISIIHAFLSKLGENTPTYNFIMNNLFAGLFFGLNADTVNTCVAMTEVLDEK